MRPQQTYILGLIFIFSCIEIVLPWNIAGYDVKWPKFDSYNPYCFAKECCNKDWIHFKRGRKYNKSHQ